MVHDDGSGVGLAGLPTAVDKSHNTRHKKRNRVRSNSGRRTAKIDTLVGKHVLCDAGTSWLGVMQATSAGAALGPMQRVRRWAGVHDRGQVGEERGHFGGQARRAQVGIQRSSRAGTSSQGKSELAVEGKSALLVLFALAVHRTRLHSRPICRLSRSLLAIPRAAAPPQAYTMARPTLSPTIFPCVPLPIPALGPSRSAHLALRKRAPLNWPGPAHTPAL
jgi:hypothetical protein